MSTRGRVIAIIVLLAIIPTGYWVYRSFYYTPVNPRTQDLFLLDSVGNAPSTSLLIVSGNFSAPVEQVLSTVEVEDNFNDTIVAERILIDGDDTTIVPKGEHSFEMQFQGQSGSFVSGVYTITISFSQVEGTPQIMEFTIAI